MGFCAKLPHRADSPDGRAMPASQKERRRLTGPVPAAMAPPQMAIVADLLNL